MDKEGKNVGEKTGSIPLWYVSAATNIFKFLKKKKDLKCCVPRRTGIYECSALSLILFLLYSSRNYPYSPHRGFSFAPPLPPGNSSLFSYIASKSLSFKIPPPPKFPHKGCYRAGNLWKDIFLVVPSQDDDKNLAALASFDFRII